MQSSHSSNTTNSSSTRDVSENLENCDRPVNLKTDLDQQLLTGESPRDNLSTNPESSNLSDTESVKSHGSANGANIVIVESADLYTQEIPLSLQKNALGGSFTQGQNENPRRKSLKEY